MQVAVRLPGASLEDDARNLMKIALSFQEVEGKLSGVCGSGEGGKDFA